MENTIDATVLATVRKAMELRHTIDGSSLKQLSGFNTIHRAGKRLGDKAPSRTLSSYEGLSSEDLHCSRGLWATSCSKSCATLVVLWRATPACSSRWSPRTGITPRASMASRSATIWQAPSRAYLALSASDTGVRLIRA